MYGVNLKPCTCLACEREGWCEVYWDDANVLRSSKNYIAGSWTKIFSDNNAVKDSLLKITEAGTFNFAMR